MLDMSPERTWSCHGRGRYKDTIIIIIIIIRYLVFVLGVVFESLGGRGPDDRQVKARGARRKTNAAIDNELSNCPITAQAQKRLALHPPRLKALSWKSRADTR